MVKLINGIQRNILIIVFTFLNLQQPVHAPNTAYFTSSSYVFLPCHLFLHYLHVATGASFGIIYHLSYIYIYISLSVPSRLVLFSFVINTYKISLCLHFRPRPCHELTVPARHETSPTR